MYILIKHQICVMKASYDIAAVRKIDTKRERYECTPIDDVMLKYNVPFSDVLMESSDLSTIENEYKRITKKVEIYIG